MKKLFYVLLASGLLVVSATQAKDKPSEPTPQEVLSTSISQLQNLTKVMNDIQKEISNLKTEKEKLQNEKESLKTQKEQVEKMITSKNTCRELISYPLMLPYDSSLVAQSLTIINYFGIDKKEENKVYSAPRLPYLEKYNEYNDEVYKMISNIQLMYFGEIPKKYPEGQFDRDIKATKYFKKYDNDGLGIPYLNDVISRVRKKAQSGELTKEFLQEIMEEMK